MSYVETTIGPMEIPGAIEAAMDALNRAVLAEGYDSFYFHGGRGGETVQFFKWAQPELICINAKRGDDGGWVSYEYEEVDDGED